MNTNLYGKEGFLYVLTNVSYPGLLKIGVTRVHPLQRVQQLSAASGVPTPFRLAYYRDFTDSFRAETMIHNLLAAHRVNESREFFCISVEDAIVIIDKLALNEWKLGSQGVIGGDSRARLGEDQIEEVPTPFANLFASFEPSDDPYLNEDEQRQCRELEHRKAAMR